MTVLTHRIIRATQPQSGAQRRCCLILHGLGDSMNGWVPVAAMLDLPQLDFVFANAPLDYHGGFSWFDISAERTANVAQVRSSSALLRELIAHLLGTLQLTQDQLFLMGFSQGHLMVLDVGLRSDQPFAGLIGISGFPALLDDYPREFGAAAHLQHLFITHGLYDSRIPIAFARRHHQALTSLDIHAIWREYPKEHTLDTAQELQDIRSFLATGTVPAA